MLLSDVSIRRPVFATMLNVVLIVFGLFSLPRLAVDQYPNVDFPIVSVTVAYPGADPASIEQRVLDPLENAVNGISGLDKLNSTAYPSMAQLVLQFKLEKNGDQAAQEVRDKVFAAVGLLPVDAETPVVQKFDIGGAPILNIALIGDGMPFGALSALAKDTVQPALERVSGVAGVNSAGIREREVQIYVDRQRLASFGLTPADVIDSVKQYNLDLPAGKIQDDTQYWSIRLKGRLSKGEDIARLPILAAGATGLRISDVAAVKDETAEEVTASFIGTTPTILLSLQKQSGSNTTQVAEEARAVVAKVGAALPKGARLEIVSDNSRFIKSSIDSVKLDLVLGALLATFIVLVFLRDWRITLISAVALPTAVIATFAFLDFMHFSLNFMSTLGLSLSIGILIDDAIIVVENIHRHLSMGKSGPTAAKDATAEIGLAVMATTMTICAVFVPVAFMEGMVGRFFYQFGLTVAFAVLVSLFVAFTFTPMLSSRLLKADATHGHGEAAAATGFWTRLSAAINRRLDQLDAAYKRILVWCLDHRLITIGAGIGIFILSFVLLRFVPVAFFPKEDRGQFNVTYTLPEGTTLATTKAQSLKLSEVIQTYPGVDKVVTAVAATRDAKPSKARLDVILVAKAKRNFSQFDLMDRLREEVQPKFAVAGAEVVLNEEGGGGGGRSEPIQLVFKSDNWDGLVAFTESMKAWIQKNVDGAIDVATTKPKPQKEYRIEVDPARAADLGVTTAQIGTMVRSLFEGGKISEIEDKGSTFNVRLRIADQDRVGVEDVAGLTVPTRRGERVTLGALAKITAADAPSVIERFDGQRQITVVANYKAKDLSKAAKLIEDHLKATLPADVGYVLSGQTEIMKSAIFAMLKALGLGVVLVFMILCAQYERYLAPMVIMAALPLSFTGAFGALLLTGQVMSIFTMIGIILLMGIVTKNGILLIDFTLERIRSGLSVKDALLEAGPIRLRPILMTTFAAGGGMIPIALGHGEGGEGRSPMGVAVIGGLLASTVLTLVVVPCLFSAVESALAWFAERRGGSARVGSGSGSRKAS